ncbi:MAG: HAD family hydrolase [Myxococcota bacterium]|nr:HAD family hydrolase [Myxococcota bacterium]
MFLFDVDNTLIDNDRIIADLRRYLSREVGPGPADEYFAIFEKLRTDLGYADYLGALQRYRVIHSRDPHLLAMSSFLVNYPFANRLFPGSLDAVEHAATYGPTVILSDGDVVFQPRKIERSGLGDLVEGRVLIYVHKEEELEDVERRYPADRYVMIDDKPRILAAIKKIWGARVTTVFVRQGHYAHAPDAASFGSPDFSIDRIQQLEEHDLEALIGRPRPVQRSAGSEGARSVEKK